MRAWRSHGSWAKEDDKYRALLRIAKALGAGQERVGKISRKIVAGQQYLSGWWKTPAELPFIWDQVVCLSHDQAGPAAVVRGHRAGYR